MSATVKKRKEPLTNEQVQQKLAEWLHARVTVRNGHCCLKEPDKYPEICIQGVRYYPSQAAYIVKYCAPFDRTVYDYMQSPLCQEKGCLQHRLLCRHGVRRMEDATPDEKQYARDYVMKHVQADGDCLLWTGGLDEDGYGTCQHFGFNAAHRLAWVVYNGRSIPHKEQIRHRCPLGRRHCVSQKHLDVGTAKQQAEDKCEDGTMKVGELNHKAKLTEAQVREIKASYGQGTLAQRGARFGIAASVVGKIDRCQAWKHLWTQADRDEAAARLVARRKRCRPRLPADLVQQILSSKGDGRTQSDRAMHFGVSETVVSRIDNGKRHTKTKQQIKDEKMPRIYEEMRLHIRASCKQQPSPDGKDQCWIYQGKKTKKGYGRPSFCGRPRFAHVISWLVHSKEQHEKVPKSEDGKRLAVCHRCDVPACCNPDHLELGTAKQNSNDRKRAGTSFEGAKNPSAKVTNEQAQEIRVSNKTPKELAAQFRVSRTAIYDVLNRKSYQNVP